MHIRRSIENRGLYLNSISEVLAPRPSSQASLCSPSLRQRYISILKRIVDIDGILWVPLGSSDPFISIQRFPLGHSMSSKGLCDSADGSQWYLVYLPLNIAASTVEEGIPGQLIWSMPEVDAVVVLPTVDQL